mmetsp:Transcript_2900/g.7787  ORF Transcript_2900/g.7787 Transcript_2900/m.7787 type:complete len:261 (-) Transcript_2900:319-1101(-)
MSSTSCASLTLLFSSLSSSAAASSAASALSRRVRALVPISVSHQPSCSAMACSSSIILVMRSRIIFFTFEKGSSLALLAAAARSRLPRAAARAASMDAARCCSGPAPPPRPTCTRATPGLAAAAAGSAGKLPVKTSTAFASAWLSSARIFCRASKSRAFCAQRPRRSPRYFWSSASATSSSTFSPWPAASSPWRSATRFCLNSISDSACETCPCSLCRRASWACTAPSSSFSRSVCSSMNLARSSRSISSTPPRSLDLAW